MQKQARGLLLLIAGLLLLWTVWATWLLPQLSPSAGVWYQVRSIGVRLVLWGIPCGVYLWTYYGRGGWRRLGLGLPTNLDAWLASVGLIAAVGAAVSIDVAGKLSTNPADVWRRLFSTWELGFPATPLFEELTFRGVVFSELLSLFLLSQSLEPLSIGLRLGRMWLANVAASLVFVGLHWPWWIYTEGLAGALLERSLPVFLLSLVLGVLFARTRSVWPCVALHWLNNALSSLAG